MGLETAAGLEGSPLGILWEFSRPRGEWLVGCMPLQSRPPWGLPGEPFSKWLSRQVPSDAWPHQSPSPGGPRTLENSTGSRKTQRWLSEPQESSWGRLPSSEQGVVSLWFHLPCRGSRGPEGPLSLCITELLDQTSPEGSRTLPKVHCPRRLHPFKLDCLSICDVKSSKR